MSDKFIKSSVIIDMDEEETSKLRQAWVQHIFNSIEKLATELYSSKEAINNRLNKINEEFYKLREEYKAFVSKESEKIKDTHKKDLYRLSQEFKTFSNDFSSYKLKCLEDAKSGSEALESKISSLKDHVDTKLTPVSKEVWIAKGKVAAMAALAGGIAATIITLAIKHLF